MIVDLFDTQESKIIDTVDDLFVEISTNLWLCPSCLKHNYVKLILPNFHMIKCAWCKHSGYAQGAVSVPNIIYVTRSGTHVNPIIVMPGRKYTPP